MSIKEIIHILNNENEQTNFMEYLCDSKAEKYSLYAILISCVASLVTLVYFKQLNAYINLFIFLSLTFYSFSSFYTNAKFILHPMRSYLESMDIALTKEQKIIESFSKYESETLNKAKDRLTFESTKIEKKVGFIIGSIDKLGLIPVLLGIYATSIQIYKSSAPDLVIYLIFGFIIGIYIGIMPVIGIKTRFDKLIFLLDTYIASIPVSPDLTKN